MDTLSTRAEFARNVTELRRIMAVMRTETRENFRSIDQSQKAVCESRDILNLPDGDANF
jgi:hypothetical protein